MSVFATKSIETLTAEAQAADGHALKRVLGRRDSSSRSALERSLGRASLYTTGQAAAAHAGPAIVVSMAIAGVASALAGLCYAEFAVGGSCVGIRVHLRVCDAR